MNVEDFCPQCIEEKSRKRLYTIECGTVDDWLSRLRTENTIDGINSVWVLINTINWSRKELKQLGFTYMRSLGNILSQELWAKPINVTVFETARRLVE
jgi:hypothetical protein